MLKWFRKSAAPDSAPAAAVTASDEPGEAASQAHKARGNAFFAEGKLAEAAEAFRQAIAAWPANAAAHFNLGLVLRDQGALAHAAESFALALQADPAMGDAAHLLGNLREQQGDLPGATALYRSALAADPNLEPAWSDLCMALLRQGQLSDAAAVADDALARFPQSAELHDQRGKLLFSQGRAADAVVSFNRAIALGAGGAELHNDLGVALQASGNAEGALRSFGQAVALDPRHINAQINRGAALAGLRQLPQALAAYDAALALNPRNTVAHTNRGYALTELRRLDEAAAAYAQALRLDDADAEVHNSLGMVYVLQAKNELALASFRRALALNPLLVSALGNLATVLNLLGQREESMAASEQLLALAPEHDFAVGYLLGARMHACDWTDRDALLAKAETDIRAGRLAVAPFSWLAMCDSPELHWLCARTYQQRKYPAAPQALWQGERYAHDRIRVAYLSADFHSHATAFLMAGLFELHDKARFETVALSFGPHKTGEMRERLERAFSRFTEVGHLSDEAMARRVRELEIDIVVDLKGYTGDARAGIFAWRAAPVQVNYIGYPGSMAADYIDYVVADAHVISPEDERWYSEKVVYLPGSYQVNDSQRRIAPETPTRADQGLPEGVFVFCCFNNNYKINPPVFDVWMRLLTQVPGSVLWLLQDNALAATNLRAEAQRRGVDPQRLVFAPRAKMEDHLARHRLADLFLDTQPYNAHTTTSDALWAGLPVVTCKGKAFPARVAASLLHAVGMPELVTHKLQDYEALALSLATSPERLAQVRERLAANIPGAALFDTDLFRRRLESAYTTMWERAQRGEAPARIGVGLDANMDCGSSPQ